MDNSEYVHELLKKILEYLFPHFKSVDFTIDSTLKGTNMIVARLSSNIPQETLSKVLIGFVQSTYNVCLCVSFDGQQCEYQSIKGDCLHQIQPNKCDDAKANLFILSFTMNNSKNKCGAFRYTIDDMKSIFKNKSHVIVTWENHLL